MFEKVYSGSLPVLNFSLSAREVHNLYKKGKIERDLFYANIINTTDRLVVGGILQKLNYESKKMSDKDKEFILSVYDAEIYLMDKAFGKLIAFLKK